MVNDADADDASDSSEGSNPRYRGKHKPVHPPQSASRVFMQVLISALIVGGLFYVKELETRKWKIGLTVV